MVKPSVLPWGEEVGKPSELEEKIAKKTPKAALRLHSSKQREKNSSLTGIALPQILALVVSQPGLHGSAPSPGGGERSPGWEMAQTGSLLPLGGTKTNKCTKNSPEKQKCAELRALPLPGARLPPGDTRGTARAHPFANEVN